MNEDNKIPNIISNEEVLNLLGLKRFLVTLAIDNNKKSMMMNVVDGETGEDVILGELDNVKLLRTISDIVLDSVETRERELGIRCRFANINESSTEH